MSTPTECQMSCSSSRSCLCVRNKSVLQISPMGDTTTESNEKWKIYSHYQFLSQIVTTTTVEGYELWQNRDVRDGICGRVQSIKNAIARSSEETSFSTHRLNSRTFQNDPPTMACKIQKNWTKEGIRQENKPHGKPLNIAQQERNCFEEKGGITL